MKWFGKSWGAPISDNGEHVETPVGITCFYCGNEIDDGDRGVVLPYPGRSKDEVAYHLHCYLTATGGSEGDEPEEEERAEATV